AATNEQRMGGLIESCAREFVAAATDLALDVGFARLVTRRRETEMGPYLSRASETIRTVDCRAKCQRGNRTYTRNPHQTTADLLRTHNIENLLGQTGEFTQHRGEDRMQRLDDRHYQDVGAGQFATRLAKLVRDGVPSLMPASL